MERHMRIGHGFQACLMSLGMHLFHRVHLGKDQLVGATVIKLVPRGDSNDVSGTIFSPARPNL